MKINSEDISYSFHIKMFNLPTQVFSLTYTLTIIYKLCKLNEVKEAMKYFSY